MSQNVAVVRRFFSSINDHRIDAALLEVAPDAELDWSSSEAPDSGVYRGRAAWRDWMTGRQEGLSDVRFDATELIDVPPDKVFVAANVQGRGRASGVQTVSLGFGVWLLRNGKLARLTLYQSRQEALTAVGLKE